MVLHIKHMVSHRCEMVVEYILKQYNVKCLSVKLGEVETDEITSEKYIQIQSDLLKFGLELINDDKTILIEQIKTTVIDLIHSPAQQLKINFSFYLSTKLKYNYTYLSNLFSKIEGMTIERFIINHKIERIKELICEAHLNITEIAFNMNYSSVAHLCNQFKKETGMTPFFFKQQTNKMLTNLENL